MHIAIAVAIYMLVYCMVLIYTHNYIAIVILMAIKVVKEHWNLTVYTEDKENTTANLTIDQVPMEATKAGYTATDRRDL